MSNKEERKDGEKLLNLYRNLRRLEVRTLNGFIPVPYHKTEYNLILNQIEILASKIGARAKTRLKKTQPHIFIIKNNKNHA